MKNVKACLLVGAVLVSLYRGFSQPVKVSSVIQNNSIINYNGQPLILLEFWTTWCAPCVPAAKQLELLQKEHRVQMFIISVSYEEQDKIKTFLRKYPSKLMVVRDFNQEMFSEYQIKSLPHAVLINTSGAVLWKGHPSDLGPVTIRKFYNPGNPGKRNHLDAILEVKQQIEKTPEFSMKEVTDQELLFYIEDGATTFQGPLPLLLKKILKLPDYLLEFDKNVPSPTIYLQAPYTLWMDRDELIERIKKQFQIAFVTRNQKIKVTEMIIENPDLLWSDREIRPGDSIPNYLIGEDRIEGNHLKIAEMASVLSDIKGQKFMYLGADNDFHDWDFHIKYDEFMKEELETGYGIKLKTTNIEAQITVVKNRN